MGELNKLKCEPVHEFIPPIADQEIELYLQELREWRLVEQSGEKRLERIFRFKNFRQALDFTAQVGEQAELEDHHPLIQTEWGRVTVQWWTHAVGGLHKNDFIMAAKTDRLFHG
jgi:4a-hydroxytetrahydrobiopterin dehydratase